ncbi:MAG TPA: hypothetical protein VFH83_09940, partial [Spirochaetia bacterium]|nr:hypothetical protein [Spirochaetia bacterium]
SGVVKGVNFDQQKNRSVVHVQAAAPSVLVRNRIHMYVYNLFGEREAGPSPRNGDRAARPEEGIVIRAGSPEDGPSVAPKASAEAG